MIRAKKADRSAVVQILSESFDDNKSVNYIVRQAAGRELRLRRLMGYAFEVCRDFGKVFISQDRCCCALVLFPDCKRLSLRSIFRDMKLVFGVIGFASVFRVLKREALVNQYHPDGERLYYIWFVGVLPSDQGKGLGTQMMEALLADARRMGRRVYLETSVERNVPWYTQLGLERYQELDLGYPLWFFRNRT